MGSPEFDMPSARSEVLQMNHERVTKKKCSLMLPWWFLLFVWILLFITMLIALTFVFFYGVMFGEYRCRLWLSSLLFAFISNALFINPIKVPLAIFVQMGIFVHFD